MPSRQTIAGILWKIYFWLLVLTIVATLVFEFTILKDVPWSIYSWIIYLSTPVGVIGLFGFAYRKPILSKRFWSIASVLAIFGQYGPTLLHGLLAEGLMVDVRNTGDAVMVAVTVLIFLPHVYALLAYGYRSDGIWRHGRAAVPSP